MTIKHDLDFKVIVQTHSHSNITDTLLYWDH